jgi:hypothetical protein
MIPTIGRIVHYTLSAQDAAQVNSLRGSATFRANQAFAGDVYPMLIVRVWGDQPQSCVNGQVFIDGDFTLWVTSVAVGEGPRHFTWPVRG